MIIKSAEFVKSAVKPDQYPGGALPEIAFAGRSNVGKSSLINTLVNRKNLVKTSATPGKTRLINFFRINDAFHFVDLPGYGYARVSARERGEWGPMVEAYLSGRPQLKGILLLQDIRRIPGSEERELIAYLSHIGLPFTCILTKADKLSKSRQSAQAHQIRTELDLIDTEPVLFSAKTRQGKDRTWETIARLLAPAPESGEDLSEGQEPK